MADTLGVLLAFVLAGLGLSLAIPLCRREYLFADIPGKSAAFSAPPWTVAGVSLLAAWMPVKLHQGLPVPHCAYVGPAQMIVAGALPLHDIPLQYGLRPSLIQAQRISAFIGPFAMPPNNCLTKTN